HDHINSSLCHGFIFDFCGVEVDRTTLQPRIDRYVSMHDCGTILHPAMVDGQIRGGFAQAIGAALYEEYAYAADGSFLTGSFADYLLPTIAEVPDPLILHMQTPSPFTPLGSKGVGEGNCMSTPVCIANGVADATVAAPAGRVWTILLDPATLQAAIPGCHTLQKISDTHFRADVTLGVGPVKGRYRAEVRLSDLDPPHAVTLGGAAEGALG